MDKPWFKTWWGVLLIALFTIILVLMVAVGFFFYNSIEAARSELNKTGTKLTDKTYPAADDKHYWQGSAKAPITIVEFGDFACTNTRAAFPTIKEISLKYKNDIKYIWRDYPVVQEYSALLALGARCAGEQGLFWPMHDKLFIDQNVSSVAQLSALANRINADVVRFNDCMDKQKYLPQIQEDLKDGQAFGNSGTPIFFINGHKIEGNIPRDIFIKIIEDLKK